MFLNAALLPVVAASTGFSPFEFVGGAAFWTILIFVLALLPMWKFVFGPISKALDERDGRLETAIQAAEKARAVAEEQVELAKAEVDKARLEGRKTVEDAISRAQRAADEQLAKARSEAERERQKALADIEAGKAAALQEIRREVVDLTIATAGKVLHRDVDDDAHRSLVSGFLGKAGGSTGA